MDDATVGEMRAQAAKVDSDDPVIVKLVDKGSVRYYRARKTWPDTSQAPAGSGFYVEVWLYEDEVRR